jgi:hypothetical protein
MDLSSIALVFAAAAFIALFSRGITFVVWCVISVLDTVTSQHSAEPSPAMKYTKDFREMGEASDEDIPPTIQGRFDVPIHGQLARSPGGTYVFRVD